MLSKSLVIFLSLQVELYTHHTVMKQILERLEKEQIRLCVVQLVDSHYCNDSGKYIATLLMSLSSMLQLGMPHLNVLSKIDLAKKNGNKLDFGLDFYTEVLNLDYLLDNLEEDSFTKKYAKLNRAIVGLVEDFSLVSFLPLDVKNRQNLLDVKAAADKANGYVFGTGEERSVTTLLSCAAGAILSADSLHDELQPGSAEEDNQSDQLLWRRP